MTDKNLRKFNLDEAKAGAPICDTVGTPVRFVAHVEDAASAAKVVVLGYNSEIQTYTVNGLFDTHTRQEGILDLRMAEDLREAVTGIVDGMAESESPFYEQKREEAIEKILQLVQR